MVDVQTLTARLQQEISDVHAFISAWFRGEAENAALVFASGLADRLDEGFTNIQPSGLVLTRSGLTAPIRAAYGSNPDFRIEISDVTLRHWEPETGIALATYVEHQFGARNTTPPDNDRISTVLFKVGEDDERPLWLHIHETALG